MKGLHLCRYLRHLSWRYKSTLLHFCERVSIKGRLQKLEKKKNFKQAPSLLTFESLSVGKNCSLYYMCEQSIYTCTGHLETMGVWGICPWGITTRKLWLRSSPQELNWDVKSKICKQRQERTLYYLRSTLVETFSDVKTFRTD